MNSIKINDSVTITKLDLSHANDLYNLIDTNREYLREWMSWMVPNYSYQDIVSYLNRSLEQANLDGSFSYGIFVNNQLAGNIAAYGINLDHKYTSLGYWIGENHQSKGVMTKVVATILDHCYLNLNLNRIIIKAAVENIKSRALPERLGFTFEGYHRQEEFLHGKFVDLAIYSLLRCEWKPQNHKSHIIINESC